DRDRPSLSRCPVGWLPQLLDCPWPRPVVSANPFRRAVEKPATGHWRASRLNPAYEIALPRRPPLPRPTGPHTRLRTLGCRSPSLLERHAPPPDTHQLHGRTVQGVVELRQSYGGPPHPVENSAPILRRLGTLSPDLR